jgi:serine/threonine protein phosphatase PrpC
VKAYGESNKGLKRENNQDSIFRNPDLGLFIIADGMGGHAHGEIASSMAVEIINDSLTGDFLNASEEELSNLEFIENQIKKAIGDANMMVLERWQNIPPGGQVMGTTVSMVLFRDKIAYTGHVGDSRIYRLRKGLFEALTKDHTQAQELVDAELLSQDEAENHRLSHILTRAVGASERVLPDVGHAEIEADDLFLLASDGLFRVLSADNVCIVMVGRGTLEEKGRELIQKTLDGGAPDNVSVIVVEPGLPAVSWVRRIRERLGLKAAVLTLAIPCLTTLGTIW